MKKQRGSEIFEFRGRVFVVNDFRKNPAEPVCYPYVKG